MTKRFLSLLLQGSTSFVGLRKHGRQVVVGFTNEKGEYVPTESKMEELKERIANIINEAVSMSIFTVPKVAINKKVNFENFSFLKYIIF